MFIPTTAIAKIQAMTARKRVVDGGTSASKTFGILAVLIDTAAASKTPLEISVIAESVPHLRRGALKDFLKIMKSTGRFRVANYNKTLLTYTFHNGSFIEFFSSQDEQGARRDILYINEAIYVPFEQYHHYAIRTRQTIYLDYNPTHPFWVHEHLLGEPDVEHLTLTYKDNEALDDNIINDIEAAQGKAKTSKFWANWWRVYGLGLLGQLQGAVFENYTTGEYPDDCDYEYLGIDFGFSRDPAAVILVGKSGQTFYIKELVYETKLLNSVLIERIKASGYAHISGVADSAEPKSIADLNAGGLQIWHAVKGPDSIRAGLRRMQEFQIVIDPSSTNVLDEFRQYTWDNKKEGKPIDAFNHAIDAIRYVVQNHFAGTGGFTTTI